MTNPPIIPAGFTISDGQQGGTLVEIRGLLQDADNPAQIMLPFLFPNREKASEFLQEIVSCLEHT